MFHGGKAELGDEDDGGDDIEPTEEDGKGGGEWAGVDGSSGQTEHARTNGSADDQSDSTPEALVLLMEIITIGCCS